MLRTSFKFNVADGDNLFDICKGQYSEVGDNPKIKTVIATGIELREEGYLEFSMSASLKSDGSDELIVYGHGTPGTAGESIPFGNINTVTGVVTLPGDVVRVLGAVELVGN